MEQNLETTDVKSAAPKPPVPVNKAGSLSFDSIESLQRLACYLGASRMLPKQYDTPEKIGTGIQFAVQLGFQSTWLLALRQIAVINGTPSMFGDLPLALVRNSGQLESIDEFLFDKDGKRISLKNGNIAAEFFGAACIVKRKGYDVVEKVFTVEDAKRAGIFGQNVWKVYPKRMIQMRVRSVALKDEFSDILNGMAIGEYDFNTTIEVASEVAANDPAAKLNAMLKPKEPEVITPSEEIAAKEVKTEEVTDAEVVQEGAFDQFSETQIPLSAEGAK